MIMNKFFIFLTLNLFCLNLTFSQESQVLKWEVLHPINKKWMNVPLNYSVQEVLIASGELPDPFIGTNEKLFNWIEEYQWEFKSSFFITEEEFKKEFIDLEFPLVDTYASIYLNDSLILKTDNFFHPYLVEVKSLLVKGENHLKVVFTPPVIYHKKRYENEKFHYPSPNDVGELKVAPYTRKPQYQFGWDWSLRMNTLGFLKPVSVIAYDENRIIGKNISTLSLNDEVAHVKYELMFSRPLKSGGKWSSVLADSIVSFQSSDSKISFEFKLDRPILWWPRGQGDAFLYSDVWEFTYASKKKELLDVKVGIKTSKLIQEADEWGTSYVIEVNGRPIFCKGADYIPQDIFPSRVTDAAIKTMVDQMRLSNFNMVRVWGGGYYPDDVFYESCDENGIMVWQDLMFACSMYPGDHDFLQNVKKEFEYQIPRISSHPSVVLFNGNNEVDVAWKNWGFQLKYSIYLKDAEEVQKAYDDLFKNIAPSVISNNSLIPYIHTSPLSNWGKAEWYNHGSMHYWGVWHGKDPIEDFGRKSGRFNAEYGFQSFPQMSTINEFSDSLDWDLESEVMKHHQKSYVGNGMIAKQSDLLYGKPKDFQEFIYFSQLTQSKAVSIAVSSHRTNTPRCMGTLYWQLNDCWQAPSWSSIDYRGNWKALQYQVQKDYKDITVLERTESLDHPSYYLISDLPEKDEVSLSIFLYDLKGTCLKFIDTTITPKASGEVVLSDSVLKEYKKQGYFVTFLWKSIKDGSFGERSFSSLPEIHTKAKTTSFSVNILSAENGKYLIQIENRSFLKDFWISPKTQGVHCEENFIDLLPGIHQVRIDSKNETISIEDFDFYWR